MISAMCCLTDVTTPIEYQINKNSKMMAFEYQNMTLKPYLTFQVSVVCALNLRRFKQNIIITNLQNINAACISFESDHIQLWHFEPNLCIHTSMCMYVYC